MRKITDQQDIENKNVRFDFNENQTERLLQLMPDLVCIFDLKLRKLTFINNRVTHFLGYTAEEIQKMDGSFSSLILHDNPRGFLKKIFTCYYHLKKGEYKTFVVEMYHKDGAKCVFRNRVTVFQYDEFGSNNLIMNILEEITHLKAHEDALVREVDILNKSNRDLEQFAYVASHDLQEPLRKIIAFGERLEKKYKDQLGTEGQFFVERMTNAAQRMNQLMEDLLAYSRASRKEKINTTVVLNELVKAVLEDLEIIINQSKANIQIGELPIIAGQPTQIHQLFLNLIENAIKFRKPGTLPNIQIEARRVSSFHQITISDNGIGFAPEYKERIFTIFQRLHGRSEYEGTGLGLAICRKIAENHHGSIEATSQEGKGTSFVICLPIYP